MALGCYARADNDSEWNSLGILIERSPRRAYACVRKFWIAHIHKKGGVVMHAVVRTYSGDVAKKLMTLAKERSKDLEAAMRPVKGLVSYALIQTADGGVSVTVCQDKSGTDESVRVAADWIRQNAGSIGTSAPSVLEGSVIVHVK
jgi:hypothetical protein